ncbi:methyltransferase [Segatella copri]|uniref:methyltransferase n=1 Tax=Segatella copri TaxID=165179 RepID=UPI003F89F696
MTNKKETLIETLRGSTAELKKSADAFRKLAVTDIAGFDAIYEFVQCIAEITDAQVAMQTALNDYLDRKMQSGYKKDYLEAKKRKESGEDDGTKLPPEGILKRCIFKDNVLYLPQVQLNKKSYATVKQWVEEAGGKWTGGKVQGFTFDFDATRVASILMQGKRCNLQQDFQFFATPPEVADWLVSLAGDFSPDCKVLEPSAGTGAIIDAIHRVHPDVVVDCYELMPENKENLSKLDHIRLLGDDFTQAEHSSEYDLIVANPPFSKNQDIRHVMQMYHDLKPGGTVAAITSRHWQQASEKVCKDFRAFLEEVSAQVYEIEEGAFKKSGTGVGTIAIVINKRDGK